MNEEIVSVDWLKQNLKNSKLLLLDASPTKTVNGTTSNYHNLCIPNSSVFNIKDNFTDKQSKFPNTIPSAEQFEKACQSLGINANSEIVVYDNLGIYTSPRVWWLFKVMGHQKISVLNGGLPEWIRKGGETIEKAKINKKYEAGNFKSNFQETFLIAYEDIIENIDTKKFLIVDARSEGRFNGTAAEPRKHLKSGSIPNSINIPYKSVLENGKFKSTKEISRIFKTQIPNEQKLVFSCGSGITACIIMLASKIAFTSSNYLYDGSWAEFAELRNLKVNIV